MTRAPKVAAPIEIDPEPEPVIVEEPETLAAVLAECRTSRVFWSAIRDQDGESGDLLRRLVAAAATAAGVVLDGPPTLERTASLVMRITHEPWCPAADVFPARGRCDVCKVLVETLDTADTVAITPIETTSIVTGRVVSPEQARVDTPSRV